VSSSSIDEGRNRFNSGSFSIVSVNSVFVLLPLHVLCIQRVEPDPARLPVLVQLRAARSGFPSAIQAVIASEFTKMKMTNGLLKPFYRIEIDELLTLRAD